MVAGHTKSSQDLLFSVTAQDFYASDVVSGRELVAVKEQHASVVIDSGRIVHVWRETMAQKCSNLPGIRGLHDFVGLHNSRQSTTMKVQESCYTGTLKDKPMKIPKDKISITWSWSDLFGFGNGQAAVRKQAGSTKSNVYQLYSTE